MSRCSVVTVEDLKRRQAFPLNVKVNLTKDRIRQWYEHCDGAVYISYSGGKDSTVLRYLVKSMYPDVPAVFCDTGLEYPELRKMAVETADVVIKPKMTFKQVIDKYGYPFPSKEQALYIRQYRHSKCERLRERRLNGWPPNGRFAISKKWRILCDAPFDVSEKCCNVMKKAPFARYNKETGRVPMIGTMAIESRTRSLAYLRHGCNAFDISEPKSTPMAFWTNQDVLRYIVDNALEIPSVYGDIVEDGDGGLTTTGVERTGCMFCMFGVAQEKHPNRFERMKETHPRQWEYCVEHLGIGGVLDYCGISYGKVDA